MGPAVALIVRLLVPLTIPRWPLFGIVASAMADLFDVVIAGAIGGEFGNYTSFDKLLDTYYLGIAFFVSLRWENGLVKWTGAALFGYRLIGVVLFEVTQVRVLLLVFPNLFERFFILQVASRRFFPRFRMETYGRIAIVVLVILVTKLPQEFALHYMEFGPWHWIHTRILAIE